MTQYGYVAYTFRIHQLAQPRSPLPFHGFDGERDALVQLYGVLAGLRHQSVHKGNRYLKTKMLEGQGRTARFSLDTGTSGQSSQFIDPDASDSPVFKRDDRHVETQTRRGVIVAPSAATTGLILLEVHGRSGVKTILAPTLKRAFRAHTGHVLDISTVADKKVLKKYISTARTRSVTVKRSGLPKDIADAVGLTRNDASMGTLELRIKAGRAQRFGPELITKLLGDESAKRSLLQIGEFQFDEIDVAMQVGERETTLTVTADHVPNFVYSVPGSAYPTDKDFFEELHKAVTEMAPAVGMTVGIGWDAGDWTTEALATSLPVAQEAPAYEHGQ